MTFLLMGFQFRIAFIVTFTVAMIVTDIMGMMYLWSIPLNAVSLVNLVMVSERPSDCILCLPHRLCGTVATTVTTYVQLWLTTFNYGYNFSYRRLVYRSNSVHILQDISQ